MVVHCTCFLILFSLLSVENGWVALGVPQCQTYNELGQKFRNAMAGGPMQFVQCDNTLTDNEWYRFIGQAGDMMPTSYVPKSQCSAQAPGWVQGEHPRVTNTTKPAKVCFDVYRNQSCGMQVSIQITDCGGFYVYRLPRIKDCTVSKIYCGIDGVKDVAQCSGYSLLGDSDRNVKTGPVRIVQCDNNITDNGWYRFIGQAGTMMPRSYVQNSQCSAEAPGWVQGPHPVGFNVTIAAKVCFDVSKNRTCGDHVKIMITDCGGFYVYRLPRIRNCKPSKVYCGTNGVYISTSSSTALKTTSSNPPTSVSPAVTTTLASKTSTQIVVNSTGAPTTSSKELLVSSTVHSNASTTIQKVTTTKQALRTSTPILATSSLAPNQTSSSVLSSSIVHSSPSIAISTATISQITSPLNPTSSQTKLPPSTFTPTLNLSTVEPTVVKSSSVSSSQLHSTTSGPIIMTTTLFSSALSTSVSIQNSIPNATKTATSSSEVNISSSKPPVLSISSSYLVVSSHPVTSTTIPNTLPTKTTASSRSDAVVTSKTDMSSFVINSSSKMASTTTTTTATSVPPSMAAASSTEISSTISLITEQKTTTSTEVSSTVLSPTPSSSTIFVKTTPTLLPTTKRSIKTTPVTHHCQEEEHEGIKWPSIGAGESTIQDCPNGKGLVERVCSQTGWMKANVTEKCRTAEINDLLKRVTIFNDSSLSESERRRTAEEIVEELANVTDLDDKNETRRLSENDLVNSVNILRDIVNLNITNATLSITRAVSNILSPKNEETWRVVENPTHVVSNLVVSVDEYGLQLGQNLILNNQEAASNNMTQKARNVELRVNLVSPGSNASKEYSVSRFPNSSFDLSPSVFPADVVAVIVIVRYNTLHSILGEKSLKRQRTGRVVDNDTVFDINREIISASVWPEPPKVLEKPIRVTWQDKKIEPGFSTECVFWKPETYTNVWSTEGCQKVVSEHSNDLICECNHLTAFAAMDISHGLLTETERTALEIISTIGCSLSIIGVILTISCYAVLWKRLHSSSKTEVRPRVLMHLCVAVGMTDVLAIAAGPAHIDKKYCVVISILLLYFVFTVFGWMLCEGIIIYLQLVRVFSGLGGRHLRVFYVVGWVIPALVVGVSASVINKDAFITEYACWFRADGVLLWIFVTTTGLTLVANVAIFVLVLKNMLTSHSMRRAGAVNRARAGVKASAVLLPLLGLTWIFGLLVFNRETIFFKYLFAIFNSLQGLMIFCCHVLINKQVHDAIAKHKKAKRKKRAHLETTTQPSHGKSISNSTSDTSFQSRTSTTTVTPMLTRDKFARSRGYLTPLVIPNSHSTMSVISNNSSFRSNNYLPDSIKSNGFADSVRSNGFLAESISLEDLDNNS